MVTDIVQADATATATTPPRIRILRAARRVLAAKGYEAATIKEIAREAGVAPGLVHYYFAGKDEMLVEMLRAGDSEYTENGARIVADTPTGNLAAVALADTRERVRRQPEWYRLRYELFALALHNATLAPPTRELLANGRAGIAQVIAPLVGGDEAEREAVAAVLLACFDGLALQSLLDPGFDLDAAYAALGRMTDAFNKGGAAHET